MGGFFGTLMTVSTLLSKLDTLQHRDSEDGLPDFRMKVISAQGGVFMTPYPFWAYQTQTVKSNNN